MVPQDQAISNANQIFATVQVLANTLATVNKLINNYTQSNMAAVFEALPTCATNPDGSLGTDDPAPVSGNVIDTRKVSNLNVAISAYEIGVSMNLLEAYVNLLEGLAVATQQYAPSVLAKTATE